MNTRYRNLRKGDYYDPYMVSHEELMRHIQYDKFSQVEMWGKYKFLCRSNDYIWITDAPEGTVICKDLVVNSDDNMDIVFYETYPRDEVKS